MADSPWEQLHPYCFHHGTTWYCFINHLVDATGKVERFTYRWNTLLLDNANMITGWIYYDENQCAHFRGSHEEELYRFDPTSGLWFKVAQTSRS